MDPSWTEEFDPNTSNDRNDSNSYIKKREISEKSRRLREAAKQRRDAAKAVLNEISTKNLYSIEINEQILSDNVSLSYQIGNLSSIIIDDKFDNVVNLFDDQEKLSPIRPSKPCISSKYENSQRILTMTNEVNEQPDDDIDKYLEQLLKNTPNMEVSSTTDNETRKINSIPNYYQNKETPKQENITSNSNSNSSSSSAIPRLQGGRPTNINDEREKKINSTNYKASPMKFNATPKNSPGDTSNQEDNSIIPLNLTTNEIKLLPKYVPIATKANKAIINELKKQKEKEVELEKLKNIRIARGREYAKKVQEQLLLKKTANYSEEVLRHPTVEKYNPSAVSSKSNNVYVTEKNQSLMKPKKAATAMNSNNDSIFLKPVRILKIGIVKDRVETTSPVFGSAYIADILAKDPYEEKLTSFYENEISKIFYDMDT